MSIAFDSTAIFRRMIEPDRGTLPQEMARYVMEIDFKPDDHRRYEELSAKAETASLTPAEQDQLDAFLHLDSLMSILRLKAQRSLRA